MNRRDFLFHSAAAVAATSFSRAQSSVPAPVPEPKRGAPLDIAHVREFVGAGHGNLPRVKEMLSTEPRLILASYDWGAGDWETALGGAAHTGRREMALHLLEAGARIDAFVAAMLGESDIVIPLVRFSPATANTRGPHGYSLLYHAGYSGNLAIANALAPHLTQPARDCNQALQTASLAGRTDFVAWLLANGADNPNTRNFQGKTPLDVALERKHDDIARLLRDHGAITAQ